jgi:ABC-type glycerol-3-phosphate transport system substrate-binding protein
MIRKVSPSPGKTRRPGRREALGESVGRPRWQRWLQRAMAPVLIAGLLAPSFPAASASTLPPLPEPGSGQVLGQDAGTQRERSFEELTAEDLFAQPIFEVVKQEWDKTFQPAPQGTQVVVQASNYSASGGDTGLQVVENFQGRPGPTLLWTSDDEGWVEWDIDIPHTGLYEITVEYYPIPGKRSSVQRDLRINGELPFREAKRIVFQRVWKESYWPPRQDNKGNDIRPPQVEVPQWEIKTIEDADGRYQSPFQFAFNQGRNSLRFDTVREPIAIRTITFHAPRTVPTYQERLAQWRAQGLREVTGDKKIKVQAEDIYLKSDPTIRGEVNFDALAEPYAEGLFKLNSFGWWRWRLPGQWARWKVTVPEDGLYQISLNAWQGWAGRRPRIRQLSVNGEVPFREMQTILFRSDREWRLETMREEQMPDGKPYLFHLKRGENIIQMDVVIGFMAETVRAIDQSLTEMSTLNRQMLMVTGSHPDPNMEWDLHEKIPGLVDRLREISDRLEHQAVRMEEIGRSKNDASSAFRVVTDQINTMVRRPADIHRLIEDFTRSQGILASWLLHLQNHPLAIEWIMVHSADANLPRVRANIFEKTWASLQTFLSSFTRDYTGLGSAYGKSDEVIDVWVGRGVEWGMIMKDMIEDDFTPATGIKVNLRVIPPASIGEGAGSVLLLATTAGEAPDVAVGVPSNLPVDFAVRGGLVNLRDFPDYQQVATRFREGALIPFRYRVPGTNQEGDWALPETQDFAMLFYRTDILHELGINPPDTWDDVYDALLKLQQNGLDFYYPPPTGVAVTEGSVGFTPFLFQNGGEYYDCSGEFCKSALGSPESLAGFQEWTDLYSNYKIPREANFFTRMRTGEQPLGVATYNTYVSLSVAAPELTGRWEMRPMPGHKCGLPSIATGSTIPCPPGTPTGTVIRTSGGTGQAVVVFKQGTKHAASWEFTKWWVSKDAQQRFGGELEALIGVEARWNTANLEALRALPWPRRDITSVLEQWRWFKEPPVVLGGYFTSRHVLNAWNRVVLQGWNPREALEEAVYDINKELAKKQEEFGVPVDPRMYRRGF